jgi:mono/diheme cytochrome c family protein
MFRSQAIAVLAALTFASQVGCNKEQPKEAGPAEQKPAQAPVATAAPTAAPAAVPAGSAEARKVFKSRCIVCHGQSGQGDGPGAAALTPKPRNYTDAEWQKSVADEELHKIILLGGAAVGKSPNMPANPDLKSKPEVIDGLVAIVRSFAESG